MANEVNILNWKKMRWNTELTDSNSLATALLTKPEISNTLAYAFGDKYHLQYLTQGSGRVDTGRVKDKFKIIGNNEFMWALQGMLHKSIPIVGAVSPASNVSLGITPFTIPLAEKYFALGDVLRFESGQQARVQQHPEMVGNEWIYTMQIVTDAVADVILVGDTAIGKELSFEFSAFEEHSQGGSSKEAFPMWFKNQMTTSRLRYEMSGSAQTDVMVLQSTAGGTKKPSNLWLPEKQYQQMLAWQKSSEQQRWYGRYNRTPDGRVLLPGTNGRPVLTGSGVLQQIAKSNRRSYTTGSEKLYREFIADLMLNSRESENKKFFAFTGRGGMDEFNSAMRTAFVGASLIDTHLVSRNGQKLTFGSDFTTYKGLLGTELTLVYNPIFDDPVIHRKIHPKTGLPQESYRFVVLDFSDYEGEPNISMLAKGADGIDRSMMMWFEAGSTTPEGAEGIKMVMRSNSLDGFAVNWLSETLIKISNPLSCGELVYEEA